MSGPQPWPLPKPLSSRAENKAEAPSVASGAPGLAPPPAPCLSTSSPAEQAPAALAVAAPPGLELPPAPRLNDAPTTESVASTEPDDKSAKAKSTYADGPVEEAVTAPPRGQAPPEGGDPKVAPPAAPVPAFAQGAPVDQAAAASPAAAASSPEPVDSDSGGVELSPDAPIFVPGSSFPLDGAAGEDDVLSRLPPYHRSLLREGIKNQETGEWYPYFVGKLKSFSKSSGYGFLACAQTYSQWRCDIFIHKSQVMTPWHLGQPCEFGIQVNARGQPQACQVFWLPRIPEPKAQQGLLPAKGMVVSDAPLGASNTVMKEPDAAAGASSTDGNAEKPGVAPPKVVERFLGTLKSFSPVQGYGFIACEEFYVRHKRDVYFDKSQLPESPYVDRQAVEFSVVYNKHGHPQARDIEWTPIPLASKEEDHPEAPSFTSSTIARLKKLRTHLNKEELELAVIAAIDMQGQTNKAPGKDSEQSPVDFVKYVLDRLAQPEEAVLEIKDFIRMLLLLMLAKMLRRSANMPARTAQLVEWFVACSKHVQPSIEDESMKQFPQVVDQIKVNIQHAARENPTAQRSEVSVPLSMAIRELLAKARTYGTQARERS